MENNNQKSNGYNNLSKKGKEMIQMYLTARQFKNAIQEEEIIILPAKQHNFKDNTVLNLEGTKITFRGERYFIKALPFIVNKSFACEVYLKLILEGTNFDFTKIKRQDLHNLFILFDCTDLAFKNELFSYFNNRFGEYANSQLIKEEISNISNAFKEWRYIYEKLDKESKVNYGFLNIFCEYLDRYSQKLIYEEYNYDVNKDPR